MHYFKLTWKLIGLEAPIFSWIVAMGLVFFTVLVLYGHWRSARRRSKELKKITIDIRNLSGREARKPGNGISIKTLDAIRQRFEQFVFMRSIWRKIESKIIRRIGREEGEEYWIGDTVRSVIGDSDVVDAHWLKNAPGIITSVGLLATFFAILIALLDVRLVNNRVQGLDLLIQGLSGKFLSSVVALLCAVIFILIERWLSSPAQTAFSGLTENLENAIPCLTSTQILSDLQTDIAEQSNAFKIFNADLSLKLKQSFGESVNPTLDRMITTIEDLNSLMRAAEAEKHKSMTEELSGLLSNFDRAIQASLGKLGDQFNTSLSGAAQTHFERMIESLDTTTSLLREMNGQFSSNQAVLTGLIQLAKETTSEQLVQGKTQVAELSSVLRQLMTQLEAQTGESLGSVQHALAAVTVDISNKVADISVQMASMVEDSTAKSKEAAEEIVGKAGELSLQSASNLERLMEKQTAGLARVEDLSKLLDSTIARFRDSIDKYDRVTVDLKKLTDNVNLTVAAMSTVSKSVKDSQEESAKVSRFAAEQAGMLKGFVQGQKDTWDKIQTSMGEYRNVFGVIDGHAKNFLNEIGSYLQDYSTTTQEHFGKLGALANEHIDNAVKRIAGSIEDLSGQLDELQTIVAGINKYAKRAV